MVYRCKIIKSLLIFLTGFIILIAEALSCHAYTAMVYEECVQGNDIEKTVERDIPKFNLLEVSGAFRINILSNQIDKYVRITGDENLLPLISTSTIGNKLLVHAQKPICSDIGVTLNISVGSLYALVSSGSDNVSVRELHTDRFSLVSEGAGDIELTGWATRFDANISGSGDLESRGLKTVKTTLNLSGSSSANVNASESLKVDILGIADVYYSGNPPEVIKNIVGAGSLNKIE